MLTLFALVLISSNTDSFPIGIWMLFGISIWIPFIVIVARKSQMQKKGTWLGWGSIGCENNWNGGMGKRREEMLLAAGIDQHDPDYAALVALKWEEVPAERRRQIFEHSRWAPKVKKSPGE
jgi:hypothetical protein